MTKQAKRIDKPTEPWSPLQVAPLAALEIEFSDEEILSDLLWPFEV